MPLEVPEDVLYILCDKLADAKDFDTLFQCALTAKRFAVPALTTLYRYLVSAPGSWRHWLISDQPSRCFPRYRWRRRRPTSPEGAEMVDYVALHHRLKSRGHRFPILPIYQDSGFSRFDCALGALSRSAIHAQRYHQVGHRRQRRLDFLG